MPVEPPKPLTQGRAWTCVLINQLATPGLGSLMCRRKFAGTGQLVLAVAGFLLLLGWMLQYFYQVASRQFDTWVPDGSYGWFGKWGLVSFGASWIWSLVTSISLLRQAKAEERKIPPLIARPPGKT